jgi:hypothetical protein
MSSKTRGASCAIMSRRYRRPLDFTDESTPTRKAKPPGVPLTRRACFAFKSGVAARRLKSVPGPEIWVNILGGGQPLATMGT